MIEIDDKKIYFPLKYESRYTQIQALNFIKSQILNRKHVQSYFFVFI